MILTVAYYIVLSFCFQPHYNFLHAKLQVHTTKVQAKTFIVKSLPFDINGLHLQYKYTVKENPYSEKPKEQVLLLDKKLIDVKNQTTVCNLEIEKVDETYPTINLSDINRSKHSSRDFDDENFDGYKDIREWCESCGGATNAFEDIYLFDPHTKKFKFWNTLAGVMLDEKNKILSSVDKSGAEINYQEFKFDGKGIELYRKEVSSALFNEKKQTYKIAYSKHIGKKVVAHKTKIILIDGLSDAWEAIEQIKKEHHATIQHIK